METPPASDPPRRGFVFRLSNAVDTFMRNAFFRLGLFVASNPYKVILFSLILTGVSLIGMLRFRTEARAENLWVPQNTVALTNQDYVNQNYGRTNRFTSILFRAKNLNVGLANQAAFLDMLDIAESGYNITADPINEGDPRISYEERCIKSSDEQGNIVCLTISVFNIFYDTSFIVRREDGKVNFFETVRRNIRSLTDAQILERLENPPARGYDNLPFNAIEIYAPNKTVVEVSTYAQISENNAIDENGESIDEEADLLEEAWTKFLLDENSVYPRDNVDVLVSSAWGQEESLSEALSGDLPLLSFGFALLGIYVILFLGDFHSVRAHRLLALTALGTAGIALGTCFGLSSAFGMFYGPVHQILPLLILGIGIDDCFHITRAADETFQRPDASEKSIPVNVALSLSRSGAAITVTSFTNVAVFLLSAISQLPALRFFALWAAIGIFFAWVYAITFYTAFVTLDMRRISAKRRDCCPCFEPVDEVKELNWFKKPPGGFSRFFQNTYGPFIMRNPVRIVILVLFIAGLGASAYGCSRLYLKFRFAFFYPSGSSQREYQDVEDDYFELGDASNIYVRVPDGLSSIENQRRLLTLCTPATGSLAQNEWVQDNSVDCWYVVMRESDGRVGTEFYEPDEFINSTKRFLGAEGFRFDQDIIFNEEESEIISTRFGFQYIYRPSNTDEIDALSSVRETADEAGFGIAEDGEPAAFPYVFFDTFSEQYAALPGEIGISLGLASVAVALVCMILVGHPIVALVSVLVVGMIIIGVLGLTFYTGINLNSVSVITLVLCTGISVDFVVHIARSFLEHVGTRKERAIKSLTTMGPPVFYAGFSTFLAIVMLAGARSYIFQVLFFGFFFLIILAFVHGLILGPVLLSFIGPPSFYADEKDKERAERELEERFGGIEQSSRSEEESKNAEVEV